MAFMDKVSNFANKAVEQAGDVVEITKIKNKIKNLEKDIIDIKCDIADFYLAKEEQDEEISHLVQQLESKLSEIESLEDDIAEIKE